VVAMSVCRVSGQLPSDGCSSVDVVNKDGIVERRSMVYTEYFARGTQPDVVCQMHSLYHQTNAAVGLVATGELPPPPHRDAVAVGPVPPPAATSAAANPETVPPTAQPAEKKKKRGFWGRLFLGSGDKTDDNKKTEDPKQPKKPER
jgi:hypothetical protein